MEHDWIYDKDLSGIDISKLQSLVSLSEQGNGLGQKELLSFIMAAASRKGKQSVQFSIQEIQTILAVLKKNKSLEEQQKIDRMFALMQQMRNNSHY